MKKAYCSILFMTTLFISLPSIAINVGDVTSIMLPAEASLAKEISNPTDAARLVSLRVERISSPMEGGVVIPMENSSELLSTPANMIMTGNSKEYFRVFYNGPADDKERYYRLSWSDEPVSDDNGTTTKKQGQAMTSAIINTILVVSPRKDRFDFVKKGSGIENTGNSSFRAIAFGPCKDKSKDTGRGCRERYYVMPGDSINFQHVDFTQSKSRIGIWHGPKFINVN